MKIKIPSLLKLFLKLLLTAFALFFVIRKIDFAQMGEIFSTLRVSWLILALLAFVISKMISAFRLRRYLEAVDIGLPGLANMKLYLLGMYYNLFLPGGIGGDGYKVWLLAKRYPVKTSRVFWAVMMDRVIGVLALFCLAVFFLYFQELDGWYIRWSGVLIPLSIIAAYLFTRWFYAYLLPVFGVGNLQSFAVQLMQLLAAWFILLSMGVGEDTEAYLLVFLLSSIVAVLPFTIGGLGAREFTFMLGARWLGLDLNVSIALSFIFYLITAFVSIWGMAYSLGPGIRSIAQKTEPGKETGS